MSPSRIIPPEPDRKAGQADSGEITFYRASEKPYGAFSNLYNCPVWFEGIVYPTAEHAYQAGKPRRDAVREWLLAAPSPSLLAMAAHGLCYWDIRPGWSRDKVGRMRDVLRAKFTQYEDLRDLLISTYPHPLVETPTVADQAALFWGRINSKGKNMLGRLLVEVREELR